MSKMRGGLFVVLLAFGVGAFLHVDRLDGIQGTVLGWILREDTKYAPQYSDAAFRAVALNAPVDEVRKQLGAPISAVWSYPSGVRVVTDGNDRVQSVSGAMPNPVPIGASGSEAAKALGDPETVEYFYSVSPSETHYRVRRIVLRRDRVIRKDHHFLID